MSFEHFIAIWPAALEPQREWSMMETPYKKKINQTHLNSNAVYVRLSMYVWDRGRGQRQGPEMQRITGSALGVGGRWPTYITSFYGGKSYSPFHFSPSVITRLLTPLPFASSPSLCLCQPRASSSLRVWSAGLAPAWLHANKGSVLQVGVTSL